MKVISAKNQIIMWSLYWGLVFAVYLTISIVFGNYILYAIILLFALMNFVVRLALINPLRKMAIKWFKYSLIVLLNLIILAGFGGLGYIIVMSGTDYNNGFIESLDYSVFKHTSDYRYDTMTGVYTIVSQNDECKILQLTDIHICASVNTIKLDQKAFMACYELIKEAQPDLIIVTGDIVYPIPIQSFTSDNLKSMYQFCAFMNNVGIPWAMVYGNHDTENVAIYGSLTLNELFSHFKSENAPMLYSDICPSIYGRYNQYLKVENKDGSLNRVLFLIDSNDYVKESSEFNDYDYVHEDQIRWYADTLDMLAAENGAPVHSFVYMHIPFQAFAEAQDALKDGSADAIYLFGENREGVSCPKTDMGFFDKILEMGSTEAVFVGHDHLNNMGVKYKGVDLVYSKSIDYIAYPRIAQMTAQRGATLVTLKANGEYIITQLNYEK